jgi:hypothetical protein
MINTQVLIDNIVTDLSNNSWTSPSSGGTTSFVAVYDYPVWIHEQGFPFLVVLDNPQGTSNEQESISDVLFVNNIDFFICANFADVTGDNQNDKKKEATLRIREAFDYLRAYLLDDSNIQAWETTPNDILRSGDRLIWRRNEMSVADEPIEELNLLRRRLSIPINDIVTT